MDFLHVASRIYISRKFGLQWFYIRAVAVGAFRGRLLVNNHWLLINHACLRVTFVTKHFCMSALQWKMTPCVMVKGGRNPALRIVTVGTRSFPGLRKLAAMRLSVTILTNL